LDLAAVLDFTLGILLRVAGIVVVLARLVFVVFAVVMVVGLGVLRTKPVFLDCCVPDLATELLVTFFLLSGKEEEDESFNNKFWNQFVSRRALSGLELP
jgi:hypothetical protein